MEHRVTTDIYRGVKIYRATKGWQIVRNDDRGLCAIHCLTNLAAREVIDNALALGQVAIDGKLFTKNALL